MDHKSFRWPFLGLLIFLAGCSPAVESRALPSDPPWGLDTITLPDSTTEIAEVMEAMPQALDAANKDQQDSLHVSYSGDSKRMSMNALSMEEIRAFAGTDEMSLAEFLTGMLESGEMNEIEDTQLDDSQPLVWASAFTQADGETVFVATWGKPNGEWSFNVEANSPEARTELIHAFVEAVGASE